MDGTTADRLIGGVLDLLAGFCARGREVTEREFEEELAYIRGKPTAGRDAWREDYRRRVRAMAAFLGRSLPPDVAQAFGLTEVVAAVDEAAKGADKPTVVSPPRGERTPQDIAARIVHLTDNIAVCQFTGKQPCATCEELREKLRTQFAALRDLLFHPGKGSVNAVAEIVVGNRRVWCDREGKCESVEVVRQPEPTPQERAIAAARRLIGLDGQMAAAGQTKDGVSDAEFAAWEKERDAALRSLRAAHGGRRGVVLVGGRAVIADPKVNDICSAVLPVLATAGAA